MWQSTEHFCELPSALFLGNRVLFGRSGVLKKLLRKLAIAARPCACVAAVAVALTTIPSAVEAGNFTIDWDTLVYPGGNSNPPAFVLTDQYGFQIDLVLQHTNANAFASPLEDTTLLGGVNDIFLGSDAGAGLGAAGEAPATGVMRLFLPGTTTPVGVNGLSFLVTDIDPVDNNAGNGAGNVDRCDMVTLTGDVGNPTLAYINGAPTGGGTNTDYLIGPSTGPGASGTAANYRTIFTATPPGGAAGAATTNLNIAANQAHCLFYFNTGFTSPSSNNDAVGSLRATYPNGTSVATVVYDEVSENARNSNTGNAAARGVGLWGGGGFSTANSITLDKQTTTPDFSVAGNTINYTYVITNVGPLPLRSTQNIQIQDDKVGTFTCPAIPAAGIAVGGTHTCTASYTVTAADVTAGTVSNIAIAGVGTGAQPFANRLQSNSDTVTVLRRPVLTLVKTITNDNGGSAATGAFTLSAAGPTSISGVSGSVTVTNAVVTAGTYNLSETAVTGYTASAWVCTAGTLTGSSLVLTNGQNATCTINNNDVAPRLTLVKTVTNDNGGTATTAAFTLSAAGPTSISGISGAATVTNAAVNAGTYTLSETVVTGYTAGAWSCTAGTLTGSSLVLSVGQTATCTINNNDVAPRLTLVKTVTNDNGGTATTTSVTLSASGPTTISGVSGAPAVTNAAVNAGTYALAETALANYTPSAWSCTSGTLTGSSLVLTVGQTATCTINNDDIAPRLTLVKTITNDNGGTTTTAAFTLTATGPTTISGVSGSGTVTNAIVTAGTYALSETNVAGYAAGSWSCTAGTLTGSNLSIGIGQSSTCTINNNDIGPVLTLVKTLTNDNGGTATTASFTLSATGPVTISGTSGAGSVTNATVNAGTYALAETSVAGYAASAWSCSAGTLTGSSLALALGQTATCTINNNDVAPRLTLVKTITNDNGGTATTAAFTLTATGTTTITGVSGSAPVTNAAVNAGTYALSETSVAGYAASAWSCTSGTLTGSNLALSVGQTATCTINNNDIAPVLTLVKTVTDTSGGPSTVSSFTLTATGPVTISGITGAPAVTNASVSSGTYILSETGPAGYTAGTWSCTAGTLTGSSLALSLAQTSTCTINNIKLPTLTLRKISNGGVGDFGFTGTNGVAAQTITTTTVGGIFTGTLMTLTAASTATDITEAMPATFWEIQTTVCTGMGTGGTATLAGNVLTLNAAATSAGRDIVCTFTNLRRPTVSVQKITTGAFGGPFNFADTNLTGAVANINTTATNTATPLSPTRMIATTTGSAVTLTETAPLTFVTAGVTCSDANSVVTGNTNPVATSANGAVTIPGAAVRIGADINCIFTNAQAVPALTVTKTASIASVSAAGTVVTYTIAVNNSGNTALNAISVTDPLGSVVCPSSGAATVTTLAAGATENCTLSYTVPQSVLNANGGGDGDIDNTATASTTYNALPVTANDSETVGLVITPALIVEKIPNSVVPRNEGDIISYIYRVTNSGNVTMTNVTISDAHIGYGTDPVPTNEVLTSPPGNSTDAAINGSWDSLAPGDVVEFTSVYTVVQADIDNLQ